MELRHIRYFLAVAEEGSFTRAAARIGIGQPPLSLQIKDLEAEVGAQLFHRLPHGSELTEAGLAFREVVGGMPAEAAAAIHAARRASRGEVGALAIGCIGSIAINPIVAAAIRAFRRSYPDVELRFEEAGSAALAAGVREGRLGAAIMRPNPTEVEGLRIHEIARDTLVAALPAAHPLALSDKAIDLSELAGDAFILTPREIGAGLPDAVLGACRAAGFEPRLGQGAPQIATLLALVAAEFGVSLVPGSLRRLGLDDVAFRELRNAPSPLALVVAVRRNDRSELVRNFVTRAKASARRPMA
jgi:DNA-binding transcriptional LysR family regulator